MRHAGLVWVLALAACGPSAATDDAAIDAPAIDAGPADAARDASHDAGLDARPPVCGAARYDLADPTTYDTAEELVVALADARCRLETRCAAPTVQCAPWNVPAPTTVRPDVDVDAARACLADIEAGPCMQYAPPSCDALVQRSGTAPIGARCGLGAPCAAGRCSDPNGTCSGTCERRTCPTCASGEVCEPPENLCRPPAGVGEVCRGDACAPGLGCHPVTGVCFDAPAAGEPCAILHDPYTATPISFCEPGLACDATGTCVVPVVADVGAACGGGIVCAPDVDCVGGVCAARPGLGRACAAWPHPCASGLRCNALGHCATAVGPGCACDDTTSCAAGYWCDDGTCTSILVAQPTHCEGPADCGGVGCGDGACVVFALGASCDPGASACLFGHCSPASRTCVPDVPLGGDCTDDGDCVRGASCERGVCVVRGTSCYTPPGA